MSYRKRRLWLVGLLIIIGFGWQVYNDIRRDNPVPNQTGSGQVKKADTELALNVLDTLEVKGRAPKTDYRRSEFGDGWQLAGYCNTRNKILARDMTNVVTVSPEDCNVVSGILDDPYTGKEIKFNRGINSSADVQIDHVVALSDAWQKGAQGLSKDWRIMLANDGLNLLAVDGQANQNKSDGDAATWLPPNKVYRCRYVARQIAVKKKYNLWVTTAEKSAMKNILSGCPDQQLPEVVQ